MLLVPVAPGAQVRLRDEDARLSEDLPKSELNDRLRQLTDHMDELQSALHAESKRAVLVVLQGRDAAGKDGTIRRVFGPLDPQGLVVTAFKAPSAEELAHDYLWRVHRAVPARGEIGIFNRSHYEDVLVVRVDRLVPESVWRPRYEQINLFERLLIQNGVVILKFFLHISRAEQRERLLARLGDPTKYWKFDKGDLDEAETVGRLHRGVRGDVEPDDHAGGAVVRRAGGSEAGPGRGGGARSWWMPWSACSRATPGRRRSWTSSGRC